MIPFRWFKLLTKIRDQLFFICFYNSFKNVFLKIIPLKDDEGILKQVMEESKKTSTSTQSPAEKEQEEIQKAIQLSLMEVKVINISHFSAVPHGKVKK